MRLLAFPVLLLAAASAPGEGGKEPAPRAAPAPEGKDKEFTFFLSRARELAAEAVGKGDLRIVQEAFDSFQSAARLHPKDPVPLAEAGILAIDTGDGDAALRMLNATHAVAPESAAFHFLRGCLLQARADYFEAKGEFGAARGGDFRAVQAEARFFQCTVGLGIQLGDASRNDDSVKVLTEAIALRPEDPLVPIAYYNLGLAHRRLQAPKEAERVFRLCIEKFPSYAPTYGELGDMLTELDRYDEAVRVLDESVKRDPSYARGWLLKANAQTTRGKFKEAEEAFREYDRQFKPSGLSEFYRGIFLQKKGEPEKAIERLQRALALDPGLVRAVYYLSLCSRELGREEEAAAYMEKWRRVEEENRRKANERIHRAMEKSGAATEGAKDGDGK